MRRMRVLSVGLILAVIGILSGLVQDVRDAQAIPAFARKYDFACSVCHVPSFPKLNDFGNLFRDHGYQLGTDQELPTWEGLTKGYWPVSFRTTVGYQFRSVNGLPAFTAPTQDVKANTGAFGFTGLDILSFGILARDISYGVVYTPDLVSAGFGGGVLPTGGTADLESAFVKFDNVQKYLGLGDNNYLMNFKVGKYELDLPFSIKRSPTLNSTMLIYNYTAGMPFVNAFYGFTGPAGVGITNPNGFAFADNQYGGNLSGIASTSLTSGYFRYSLDALTNQNNDGLGTTGGGRAVQFYGHATQSFDGYGIVSGHRIGIFGMHGKAPTAPNDAGLGAAGPGTGGANATFSRIGLDASTTWGGQVNVFGAWMFAKDTRPMFSAAGVGAFNPQEARWNGGFIEADYNPVQFNRWLLIYRYDWITNTQQPDGAGVLGNALAAPGNFNNVQQQTGMVRYNFHITNRTDVAWHIEYNHLTNRLTAASGGDQKLNQVMTGIDFAF